MDTTEIPQLLNRAEFADLMKVKPRTVDTWIARKKISDASRVKLRGQNYFRVEKCMEDLGMTLAEWMELRDKM
jgi:hypothetical protein